MNSIRRYSREYQISETTVEQVARHVTRDDSTHSYECTVTVGRRDYRTMLPHRTKDTTIREILLRIREDQPCLKPAS